MTEALQGHYFLPGFLQLLNFAFFLVGGGGSEGRQFGSLTLPLYIYYPLTIAALQLARIRPGSHLGQF